MNIIALDNKILNLVMFIFKERQCKHNFKQNNSQKEII